MNGSFRCLAVAALVALTVPLAAQQDVPAGRGGTPTAPQGIKIPPLPAAPVRFETGEGQTIRVSVYARGFNNPWSMAWVSDDTMLVAERGGAIKVVRKGVVDPQPVSGAPVAVANGLSGTDLALHPDFERNHYIYISYTKPLPAPPGAAAAAGRAAGPAAGAAPPAAAAAAPPAAAAAAAPAAGAAGQRGGANAAAGGGGRGGRGGGQPTTLAVARATWNGTGFTDLKDIFVGEGGSGGPIVFGGDGMLYVASGGGDTQNPKTLGGKILPAHGRRQSTSGQSVRRSRRREARDLHDGPSHVPADGQAPVTGAIWQIENGPNGGDEVNVLVPGANYGWPLISLGRTYPARGRAPFTKEGFRDPVIYWMPAIAVSSITFYTGDKLPKWKGDVFVSGMRYGEILGTGRSIGS